MTDPEKNPRRRKLFVLVLAMFFAASCPTRPAAGEGKSWQDRVRALAGGGAVLVSEGSGRHAFALHPHKPMTPASILKVVTAAAALDILGPDYRFRTIFRLSQDNDLHVIGRGDPHLVSEEWVRIVRKLKSRGLKKVRHILLDDRFFDKGLVLHGTNRSLNPYDAFNGALCANFNTAYVRIGKGRRVTSAEPQTPITPLAKEMALKSGLKGKVRINLAENPALCPIYAGQLLNIFLTQAGIAVHGKVKRAKASANPPPVVYTHFSSCALTDLIGKMFEFSNNFIANQIFLTMGAEKYGPPATAEKSRKAVALYLKKIKIPHFHMEEGSGLSRRTRITASQMIQVLNHFKGNRYLLKKEGPVRFKTGTLHDVKSLAGYLLPVQGDLLPFVIMLNGKYSTRTRGRILGLLKVNLL